MESVFNNILAKPLHTLAADEIDTIKVNSISFPDGISGNDTVPKSVSER